MRPSMKRAAANSQGQRPYMVDLLPRKDTEPRSISPVTVLLTTPRNRVSAGYRRLGRMMFFSDAVCLLLAMLVAYLGWLGPTVDAREAVGTLFFGAVSLLIVFKGFHLNEV